MKKTYLLLLAVFASFAAFSQPRTVGLTKYSSDNQDGYCLFSPLNSKVTFLIDKCGQVVHQWTNSTYTPGLSVSLFPDGSLLRCGTILNTNFGLGIGGSLEKFDWDGKRLFHYIISDSTQSLHHDVKIMPNGNLLAIVWEKISIAKAIAAGRDPSKTKTPIWSEHIIEIQPLDSVNYDIVWEWKAWDHLIQDFDNKKPNYGVVADHPELFNLNFFLASDNGQDWFHMNCVDFNPGLDQIVLTAHSLSEFYIIDHSTNLLQATSHKGGKSGKGGDILYRWGNPQAYNRGNTSDQKFYLPHHAHWIKPGFKDAGSIMIFNNGNGRPGGNYSTVEVIKPPMNVDGSYILNGSLPYAPAAQKIAYKAPVPSDFYAMNVSSAFSLDKGGLFVTCGPSGRIFETDSTGKIIWQYINPITSSGILAQGATPNFNSVFRCEMILPDNTALSDHTLTPTVEIEKNPYSPTLCVLASTTKNEVISGKNISIYPNPANGFLKIKGEIKGQIFITDITGKRVASFPASIEISIAELPAGSYIVQMQNEKGLPVSGFFIKN